ncbi:MAG: TRAP transporter substrate-binding protein DctP [Selenomonadaceae bacterium]|nr:TRAP transporter substrate-binding protein DctP [Selenomonadaceae bacterium]
MEKRVLSILLIFILLLISVGCDNNINTSKSNEDYQKIRMMMTSSGTEIGINTVVAKRIAEIVEKESGGSVIIEVYPNDQISGGNTTKGLDMLADGSVDLAVFTSGTFSMLDNRLSIATFPWTFANYEEARKVIDDTGGLYYTKILSQKGLVYLGSVHNGFRQISNNRNPVRQPEDLAGMKIRILNNEMSKIFFQSFDAVPMLMSRSEMAVALKQGYIDGHDMGLFQSASANLNEIEKYVTLCNYSYENYIFVINSKIFNQLKPKTQELLIRASKEACQWGNDWIEQKEQDIKLDFIKSSVAITELSPEELNKFKEQSRPMIDQLKMQYDDEACRAFGIN